jgi:hypothetical protein
MEWCDGTRESEARESYINYSVCVGYLAGVNDAAKVLRFWGQTALNSCLPEGVGVEQLRQVVLRWMRSHPGQWHLPAGGLVLVANSKVWPCR